MFKLYLFLIVLGGMLFVSLTLLLLTYRSLKKVKSQKALADEKLEALYDKLRPHFLYNALSAVCGLMYTDTKGADALLNKIAKLLRNVLATSKKETHSLEKELDISQTYIAIEKTRFGDRFESTLEIDSTLHLSAIKIPVLTIHPLVEYAILNAVSSDTKRGHVDIRITRRDQGIEVLIEEQRELNDLRSELCPITHSEIRNRVVRCRLRLKAHYHHGATVVWKKLADNHHRSRIFFPQPQGAS
jgi:LytS/YehU family sensor histidine kinase